MEVAMKLLSTKSLSTKSLITKSLIRSGIVAASLTLAGSAFAAGLPIPHAATTTNTAHMTQRVDVGPLYQGLFGMPIPVHVTAGTAGDTGGYDPTFDSPSPTVDVDNSQSQAAIDTTDQAIQGMDQDIFQMDESVINNGM